MQGDNPFTVLFEPGDSETSCTKRKAEKKLREIDKLKFKMNKTPEEYDKIRQESIWRAIVEPVLTCASETPEKIEQRKTKQREKSQIKEFKRKLTIQKEEYKQSLASMQRKWEERMRLLQEENQRLKVENQQLKKNNCSPRTSFNYNADAVSMEEKIEDEFHELYQQNGTYKQTYKELILKYHPDKNNTEIGHKITTILNILKQRYKD
tara:strand:- start:42314 stop:42937 length:624 start_codon:yes stop_codon:yes gene_type:complete